MRTIDAVRDFISHQIRFRLHPVQRNSIEEECLVITEVIREPGQLDPLDLGQEAPMILSGIRCVTDREMPPDEIAFEVAGKEVARIVGLEVPGSY